MESVQKYSFIPFQTTKISPFKIIFLLGFFLSGCINRGFIETNQNTNFDNDPLRITLPADEDLTSMLPGRVNNGNEESNSVERNEIESYSAGIREDFIDFPRMHFSSHPDICNYSALKNVNCRESDHMDASIIAILLIGDQGKIIAINPPLTHGKFVLESQQECWIYLGLMDGPEDPVDTCRIAIEKAPLPGIVQKENNNKPDSKSCSKDLGQSACLATGGSWVDGGAVGASYCNC